MADPFGDGRDPLIKSMEATARKRSREAEREDCAKVADAMRREWVMRTHQDGETRLVAEMLGKCAAAIRSRAYL